MTMGPPQAREALAECLALGRRPRRASVRPRLCRRRYAGDGAGAGGGAARARPSTSFSAAATASTPRPGRSGPEIAELLDWPQVTVARTLDARSAARARCAPSARPTRASTIVTAPLPALVTAAEDLAPERFTTKAEREAAQAKPIATLHRRRSRRRSATPSAPPARRRGCSTSRASRSIAGAR